MSNARIVNEVYTLSTLRAVAFDLQERWIEVQEVPTPDGWTPDTIDIRFELPASYPEHRPHVYMPDELQLRGQRPNVMAPATQNDDRKWCPFDIGPIEWTSDYTLKTAFSLALSALDDLSGSPGVSIDSEQDADEQNDRSDQNDDPDDTDTTGHQ